MLTLGTILLIVALVDALAAALMLMSASKNRADGAGTPDYARARDSRRIGLWLLAGAVILVILGSLTPLANVAIG